MSGNKETISFDKVITFSANNHEEADSLIVSSMIVAKQLTKNAIIDVYSADTDVFFILLKHCHVFNCETLYHHLVSGWINITEIQQFLGQTCSDALLTLHPITGCDKTGKFETKTKQYWFQRFMMIERKNNQLVSALADFQRTSMPEIDPGIESFVCRAYLYITSGAMVK